MRPAVYNISVQRRADFRFTLELASDSGTPIDLTGATVLGQVWDPARSTKHADFTVEYLNRPQGRVRLLLEYTKTTTLPNEAEYDVMVISAGGLRDYYLEGSVLVSEGYTAP